MSPSGDGLRVFMTADAVGGVWTYAADLARGLAARGDRVTLAVLGPSPSAAQRRAVDVDGVELVETDLPLDWTATSPVELRRTARVLAAAAARLAPHVVHLNTPALAGAGAAWPAPVVGVAHSCLKTWWSAVRGGGPPLDFAWRIRATAEGYAACSAVIAPSVAFAAATKAAYGVSPLVVRNGRASAFAFMPDRPRDTPVITTGRLWDDGKDVATLDAAAACLGAPILALGPLTGPIGQAVRFSALEAPGACTPHEIAAMLARSRVFVSAARYEPFGLSVLEAAQAGCALVLSDIPTFRELWGGAAVFVPPGDAEGFASALRALLSDDAARARLAAAARDRADRYGVDAFVEATSAVHRSVRHAPSQEAAA